MVSLTGSCKEGKSGAAGSEMQNTTDTSRERGQ